MTMTIATVVGGLLHAFPLADLLILTHALSCVDSRRHQGDKLLLLLLLLLLL